jgi:uncharacterized protein
MHRLDGACPGRSAARPQSGVERGIRSALRCRTGTAKESIVAVPDQRCTTPGTQVGKSSIMKFTGEVTVNAPRAAVYEALRDARFFASCVDGVRDLVEIGTDRYSAIFETKVAYMKFTFKVTVELTRADAPREIEAKVEGTPLGVVGRMVATSVTTLSEDGDGTRIDYAVDAALTGKLGSLGQPVLRSKAREMEKQFAARLSAAFAPAGSERAQP